MEKEIFVTFDADNVVLQILSAFPLDPTETQITTMMVLALMQIPI